MENNPQKQINNAIGNLNAMDDESLTNEEVATRIAAAEAQAHLAAAMILSGIGTLLVKIEASLAQIAKRVT